MNNTLHIIRTSGFSDNNLLSLSKTLCQQDSVILLDDGCYNINHQLFANIISVADKVYAISEHTMARGLYEKTQKLLAQNVVTMDELSSLIFNHQRVLTWQ